MLSVRAVANSADGPERGIQTKSRIADLFVFRVGGKPRVVSRRGVITLSVRDRERDEA